MKSGNSDYVIKKTKVSYYFIPLPLRVHASVVFVSRGKKEQTFTG